MKKNHIRVVSENGIRFQITDAQTGAVIPGVRGVTIRAPRPHDYATVELECICAEVDVIAQLQAVEFVTVQGKRWRFEAVVESQSEDVTEAGDTFTRRHSTSG